MLAKQVEGRDGSRRLLLRGLWRSCPRSRQ